MYLNAYIIALIAVNDNGLNIFGEILSRECNKENNHNKMEFEGPSSNRKCS